jgi:hypothetical protein
MKNVTIVILCMISVAAFGQQRARVTTPGADKHAPSGKDNDKSSSKDGPKLQLRKSGKTNGLADTTRQLRGPEHNTQDRSEDFSASASGTASVQSENGGYVADGTNTAQRASYNMAGSPMSGKAMSPHIKKTKVAESNAVRNNASAKDKGKKKQPAQSH